MKKSIAAAVSFALAAVVGVGMFALSAQDPVVMMKVVKVKNSVIPSTVLLEDNLVYDVIPADSATKNMVKSIEEAKGTLAQSFIGEGSYLYKYQIDTEDSILGLKKNQVPLRLPIDLVTFGGARPGDYVDVLSIEKVGTKVLSDGTKVPEFKTTVLLPNVRVVNHVLSNGSTKTLVHNQLYGEDSVVTVSPDNVTVPPMETSSVEVPSALDLAVTTDEANKVDSALASGAQIKLRVNPWPTWEQEVKDGKLKAGETTGTKEDASTVDSLEQQPQNAPNTPEQEPQGTETPNN